jgi:hypothetical protein
VADFSKVKMTKDEEGEEQWLRGPDQAPDPIQEYLIYVLCRRHFVKLGLAWCQIEYSQNLRT